MGYWSVAILFWQLSIDHIVNVLYKRCGHAKTPLRHPSLPFDSLPYPTRTICRRVRTLGQSRDNQTKRGWPYSISMGLCPTRASRLGAPLIRTLISDSICVLCVLLLFLLLLLLFFLPWIYTSVLYNKHFSTVKQERLIFLNRGKSCWRKDCIWPLKYWYIFHYAVNLLNF